MGNTQQLTDLKECRSRQKVFPRFDLLKDGGYFSNMAFVFARSLSLHAARHNNGTVSASFQQTKPHFNKILIANRGEIACRVMRTAKRLNVRTVAVYSDADRHSMHTHMADEAYHIGPAASAESYLRMDKLVSVAKAVGAQGIHPGYGFLSERAKFSEYCQQNGVVFIGPPAQAIRDMGSKSESKKIMERAKVPVVPGYHGDDQTLDRLKSEAERIGYPVLIKAVSGGGGKGMRIVEHPKDFEEMLMSSKRESLKSFGDDNVLVEKYLIQPRHVEVQVFADTFGNTVYLSERDCSVQRRHQKIIEEAPAPGLSAATRAELGKQAVNAAKAVNYVGAGTVEFIMDSRGQFYFMEMNTRLQVEHPITELITGTDLVEWQLLVAAGNTLPMTQEEILSRLHGHAFEARVYAENPRNNFLPDTGHLYHLRTPEPSSDVNSVTRVEMGVRQGDDVSVFYDPLIAKLVVWSHDRTSALRLLANRLDEFEVVGPETNIDFLKTLSTHPAFINAEVETGFIAKHKAVLLPENPPAPSLLAMSQAMLAVLLRDQQASKLAGASTQDPFSPTWHLSGRRFNNKLQTRYTFTVQDRPVHADVTHNRDGSFDMTFTDGKLTQTVKNVDGKLLEGNRVQMAFQSQLVRGSVVQDEDGLHIIAEGGERAFLGLPAPEFLNATAGASAGSIFTPMPCKITQVLVQPGQVVKADQPLLILEAMKMEHVIRAPFAGVVERVSYKEGDLVPEKTAVVVLKDQEAKAA